MTNDSIQLRCDPHGRLYLRRDEAEILVSANPCFPWSYPNEFVSLRDADGDEQCLLESIESLPADSAAALRTTLKEASFVLRITRITSVEKQFELRHWQVETEQGARRFQTRLDDWPRTLPHGGSVLQDVGGDQYGIPPLDQLDAKSRALLWPYLDASDS